MFSVLPAVCCSSFACPAPDPAQEGYCWPGGASGRGKAEMVMGGHRLTGRHPGNQGKGVVKEDEITRTGFKYV